MSGIAVIVPSIPKRSEALGRALHSVYGQTYPARQVCVAVDTRREGAAATRQRALELSLPICDWVAFLDDDDEFLPRHLMRLMECAEATGADYVFSWFVRHLGGDPLGHFGKIFNPAEPHHTTMTVMVRRGLALEAGFRDHEGANPNWSGEDWRFTLRCIELGANIVHLPEETWIWRRHRGNTSGVAGRGDAA